jgi:sugar phosphate isomerase/epimerase
MQLPPFSLAPLTTIEVPPPAFVRLAAKLGYDHAGIRLAPAAPGGISWPLWDNPPLLRETEAALADTGISILDIELIRLNADSDPRAYLPMLETGARLGGRTVLVAGDDPDLSRFTDRYAALCDLAAPFGLTADLEFMPFTELKDLAAAIKALRAAGRPNSGVIVDTLHFDRSFSRIDDLKGLPGEWLHYWQICDGPAEQPATIEAMIHTARVERMFPGEGGIDLAAIIRPLPRNLPCSIEIPTGRFGSEERAARALETSKALLAAL